MKEYKEAEQDYLSDLKYKDITDKYGVSISTDKSWKSRYWKSDDIATKDKKVAYIHFILYDNQVIKLEK
ncbi:hypothetical protein ACF0HZ_02405 [Leuconostoc suionicum]|uniref:hypothetical protein n=1 Tax=Leuconostoc suionicum TaxID=1511761 RepID=UPI003747CE08